jgi:uncharacterized protein with FMN-binding domain
MKKIFLSFGLITAFAIFATLTRRNTVVGADSLLAPNVSILSSGSVGQGQVATSQQPRASSGANPPTTQIPSTVTTRRFGEDSENENEGEGRITTTRSTPTVKKTTTVATAPTPAPAPAPAPAPKGQYKDGTYTGPAVDAYYGYIQVQAVVSGGKLADVVFLQYPNDRSTSVQINSQAMPYLKEEAIQAQSANVNIVSGASDSSQAFIQSLGSALAMAAN